MSGLVYSLNQQYKYDTVQHRASSYGCAASWVAGGDSGQVMSRLLEWQNCLISLKRYSAHSGVMPCGCKVGGRLAVLKPGSCCRRMLRVLSGYLSEHDISTSPGLLYEKQNR